MFLSLANVFGSLPGTRPDQVLLINALQLSRWLDEVWAAGGQAPPILTSSSLVPFLGSGNAVASEQLPTGLLAARPSGLVPPGARSFSGGPGRTTGVGGLPFVWDHLVYAYLAESTGIVEIMTEVVRRLLTGETLGTLTPQSMQWLRTTEDLFFKDPPLFAIHSVVSEVRPATRATRRNAYWRMFGLDLPHDIPERWRTAETATWKTDAAGGVNTDFRSKWTEFLRQVWLGVENQANTSGANPADPEYLVLLCAALRDMLHNRRRGGQLAREEFSSVALLSWYHLTVSDNSPMVTDLQCTATSVEHRLAALAQRVGMRSAAATRELFDLALPMSRMLRAIELDLFGTGSRAAQLYLDPTLRADMTRLIDNWQSATGERVKERPLGSVAAAQPLRVPAPATGPAAPLSAGNGARA